MTKLTSLVLRKKEVEENKVTLKQRFKNKLRLKKKGIKSSWESMWHRSKESQTKVENNVGSVLTINLPITIYNTNVNNYYNNKENSEVASTTTSIVKQLIVLSPFQIYGFLFVCSLLLIVVGFGILQVHRIITILQTLLDGVKYFIVGFFTNSLNLFTFLKSLIS